MNLFGRQVNRADCTEGQLGRLTEQEAVTLKAKLGERQGNVLKIIVIDHDDQQHIYEGVTALGIGHNKQDLVIVCGDAPPVRISPDQWIRLEIDRVEVSMPSPGTLRRFAVSFQHIQNLTPRAHAVWRRLVTDENAERIPHMGYGKRKRFA